MRLLHEEGRSACGARLLLVAGFAAIVAFAGVFSMPPLDRDESRFAQATVQMLESGDYVSIRFQDDERNKKPAGIHWLQAASVAAFSSVEAREIWAYRLPSALGAVLAALFTYAIGARLYGPRAGLLAALLLASAPGLAGEAMIAKTDAMLLAAIVAAQAGLIHVVAAVGDGKRPGVGWPAAFWMAIGAGILIKGPIILMIVGLTALALSFRQKRADWIAALRPFSGALLLVLMVAPWALAIHEATDGRFFAQAVGGDMIAKIGDAKESHGGPPGYHALLVFILFWPAAALIAPALRLAFETGASLASSFLIGWIAPAWIIFELTATKLPHYTLPLYPAIALLAARAATVGAVDRWPVMRRAGAAIFLATGLSFAAAIAALPLLYQDDPARWRDFTRAGAFAGATLAVAILYWRSRALEATLASIALSAALAWTLLGGAAPGLDRLALSPRIAAAIDAADLHALRDKAPPTVLSGFYEPSAIFLLGTDTILAEGRAAAERIVETAGAAVVEARQAGAFQGRLAELKAQAVVFAKIDGVNYSNGDEVTLLLYRLKSPAEDRR